MRRFARFLTHLSVLIFALAVVSIAAFAQSRERVLYAFAGLPDCGNLPAAPLVADEAGNLYGTTIDGGAYQHGCVFKLSRTGSTWNETVLYSFSGPDGDSPSSALVFDKAGNLYGTTLVGGAYGGGTAFELSPLPGGGWTETVLHSFGNGVDGYSTRSNLIFDESGNLYGTTNSSGGNRRGGSVFKLSPSQNGWTEMVLYTFPASIGGPDGDGPAGGVVMDREGKLYGATEFGGASGYGAVYELARLKDGKYRERIIHSFNLYDGFEPASGLTIDRHGILYGTTAFGGDVSACIYVGCGIVFQLTKDATGSWTENVLLQMIGSDGANPLGPVVFDRHGNLFAVGQYGGAYGIGSVFKLTPTASGPWKETVLHSFHFILPNGTDGSAPYAGVIVHHGRVFGTTSSGGIHDLGSVFELRKPVSDDESEGEGDSTDAD
jgi:uncharacterized repeat protein (TIGR03803 family)